MFISSCFLWSGQIAFWSPLVAKPIAMLWYDRKQWISCRVVIVIVRKYWIEILRFLLLIQCKDGGLFKARRRRRSVAGVIIFNQKELCTACRVYGSPWRARVVNFTAFTKTLYMRRRQNEKLQVLSQQRRGLEILKQFHDSHLSHFFPTGLTEPSV